MARRQPASRPRPGNLTETMEGPQRLFQAWFGRFATESKEHLRVFPREHAPRAFGCTMTTMLSSMPDPSGYSIRRADWRRDRDAIRRVRQDVFAHEQGVPESPEWNNQDAASSQIGRMAVSFSMPRCSPFPSICAPDSYLSEKPLTRRAPPTLE